MTPARLNPPTIVARLRLITEAVEDLRALENVTAAGLERDRPTRRIIERCLQLCVDAAAAINAHVAAAVLGDAPRDLPEGRQDEEALPPELSKALAAIGVR